MKKILISLLLVISSFALKGATITNYIDPSYTGTSNGTITQPYKDIPAIISNNIYLLKGGTTLKAIDTYGANADNVKISTYGTGRANIYFNKNISGRLINLRGSGNLIENLNVITDNRLGADANRIVSTDMATPVEFYITGGKSIIRNVSIKGGWRGFVAGHYDIRSGVLEMDNVSIDSVQHDGMYITYLDSCIVRNSRVTNCNLAWKYDFGGDCLQNGENFHVIFENLYLDHSNSIGKYCLITNSYYDAIINNCTFVGNYNQAGIYPSSSDSSKFTATYITNCKFIGGKKGIENRSDRTIVKNCVFIANDSTEYAIDGGVRNTIQNCTFVNHKKFLIGSYGAVGTLVTDIDKCIFSNNKSHIQSNTGNLVVTNSNFFNTPKDKGVYTNITNLDPQFDENYISKNTALNGIGSNLTVPVIIKDTSITVTPPVVITPSGSDCKASRDSVQLLLNSLLTYKDTAKLYKIALDTATNRLNRINILIKTNSTLTSANKVLNDSVTSKTNQITSLKNTVTTLTATNKTLTTTNSTLTSANKVLNDSVTSKTNQITSLKSTVTTLTSTNKSLTTTNKVLNDSVTSKTNQITSLKNTITNLTTTNKSLNDSITLKNNQIKNLNITITSLNLINSKNKIISDSLKISRDLIKSIQIVNSNISSYK